MYMLSHFTQRPLQRDTVFGGDAIFDNQKMHLLNPPIVSLFIYLGFYVAFNTVQVISRRVVGKAEETST